MSSGSRPATAMARLPAIGGQRGGRLVRRGDAPLADAGARADPLVGGVDQPLEVGVGQHALRRVHPPAGDADAALVASDPASLVQLGSTSMSACLALTSAPFSAAMRTHAAGDVALDLVEQLHGLDEPDDLADD